MLVLERRSAFAFGIAEAGRAWYSTGCGLCASLSVAKWFFEAQIARVY